MVKDVTQTPEARDTWAVFTDCVPQNDLCVTVLMANMPEK